MTATVNGVTIILTKEQLQHIENQTKKESQQASAEGRFLELVQGLEMVLNKSNTDCISFYKNKEWYFDYNLKTKILWCQCCIGDIFYTEFGWNVNQICSFFNEQSSKHFKLDGLIFKMIYVPIL